MQTSKSNRSKPGGGASPSANLRVADLRGGWVLGYSFRYSDTCVSIRFCASLRAQPALFRHNAQPVT